MMNEQACNNTEIFWTSEERNFLSHAHVVSVEYYKAVTLQKIKGIVVDPIVLTIVSQGKKTNTSSTTHFDQTPFV